MKEVEIGFRGFSHGSWWIRIGDEASDSPSLLAIYNEIGQRGHLSGSRLNTFESFDL